MDKIKDEDNPIENRRKLKIWLYKQGRKRLKRRRCSKNHNQTNNPCSV